MPAAHVDARRERHQRGYSLLKRLLRSSPSVMSGCQWGCVRREAMWESHPPRVPRKILVHPGIGQGNSGAPCAAAAADGAGGGAVTFTGPVPHQREYSLLKRLLRSSPSVVSGCQWGCVRRETMWESHPPRVPRKILVHPGSCGPCCDLVRLLFHEVRVLIDPSPRPVLDLNDAYARRTDGHHVDLVRLELVRDRPGEVGQQNPVVAVAAERRFDAALEMFECGAFALVGERPAVEWRHSHFVGPVVESR